MMNSRLLNLLVFIALVLVGCSGAPSTDISQAVMADEAQPSPSPSPAPTETPVPSATPEPTPTPIGGSGTIVYIANDWSIHLAELYTSARANSTALGFGDGVFPAWSPDGSTLAFLRIQGDLMEKGIITAELHVMDADDYSSSRKLADLRYPQIAEFMGPPTSVQYNHVFWSPDGKWLAYLDYVSHDESKTRRVHFELRMVSVSRGDPSLLAETTFSWDDPGFLYRPLAWSPDSSRIAYASYNDASHGLYLINVDGSSETQLTASRYPHSVNWMPDGASILFIEDPHDGSGIPHIGGTLTTPPYIQPIAGRLIRVALDGMSHEELTTTLIYEPVVSPDGQWVAYVEEPNRVIALQLDGEEAIEIALACTYIDHRFELGWSPDSELVALRSATALTNACRYDWYGIHVYTLQGTEVVRIESPWGGYSISPDSSLIAVSGRGNLMIGDLWEGAVTHMDLGQAFWPAWRPVTK